MERPSSTTRRVQKTLREKKGLIFIAIIGLIIKRTVTKVVFILKNQILLIFDSVSF